MRGSLLVLSLLVLGCGRAGLLPPGESPDAAVVMDAAPVIENPGYPMVCGALPCPKGNGGHVNDAGIKLGATGSALDGPCPTDKFWTFPNQGSTYCGDIADACSFVCGTPRGCTVDVLPNIPYLQMVYCPGDNGARKLTDGGV